jgi:prolyl 4-hydroxylase
MIPKWEYNNKDNFIAGGYIDYKVCDDLINYFDNCKYKMVGEVGQAKGKDETTFEGKIDKTVKASTDLSITSFNNDKEIKNYYKELDKVLELYKDKYKYCDLLQGRWTVCEKWNIQKYEPKEGFYAWHTERICLENSARHLVFMTYLNDVTDGGETEFYYQKLKVQPKKGLTIIWPADWTFTHKGITSDTQSKYICTGWYSYF